MNFKRLILLVFLATNSFLFGQISNIDSLKLALKSKQIDSSRVSTLQYVYNYYVPRDKVLARKYSDSIFQMITSDAEDYAGYVSWYSMAYLYFSERKTDSVIYVLKKAMPFAENLKDPVKIAELHSKLALTYSVFIKDTLKVIHHNDKVIELHNIHNLPFQVAQAYYTNGTLYRDLNDYPKALEYLIKADSLKTTDKLVNNIKGHCSRTTGQIFSNLKKYDKAEQYFDKAITYYNLLDNISDASSVMRIKGNLYMKKGAYQEAITIFKKAEDFFDTTDDDYEKSELYMRMSDAYLKVDEPNTAHNYITEAKKLKIRLKDSVRFSKLYSAQGNYFMTIKRWDSAKVAFSNAYDYSKKYNISSDTRQALKSLAIINEELGFHAQALEQLKAYYELRNNLYIKRNEEALSEIELKYQTALKDNEIAQLKFDKEISNRSQREQLFYVALALILLASGILFFWLKSKNRKSIIQVLQKTDKEKTAFYTNISHELRTPLTLIQAPLEDLLKDENPKEKNALHLIKNNADRMLDMVDQMTDLSRIASAHLKLKPSKTDLRGLLIDLLEAFTYKAKSNQLDLKQNIDVAQTVVIDVDIIQKIVSNLLDNAIKYTDLDGKIQVDFYTEKNNLKLKIVNTNSTITQEELLKLFERFKQQDYNTQGMGVGLSLVSELVKLHNGTLKSFKNDDLVNFEIDIPCTILTEEKLIEEKPLTQFSQIENDNPQSILIVEDQSELRDYIVSIFKQEFQVLIAKDGEEGVSVALKQQPNLIISDVMMPKISGIELCNTLKKNVITSHIPIVLLTAKSTNDDKLEGLQHGAEAYVTKPFKSSFLKEQVKTILNQRAILQERFTKSLYLKPIDVAIVDTEKVFLSQIQEVFDDYLTNPDFSAEQFAQKMNMSRMQLHRKLKSLVGLSTSEFIRAQRLQFSLKLLKNQSLTISEVAYSSGFSSPSIYSKHFKAAFGCSPSAYTSE